jgi:hypothetical protein
LYRYSKGWDYTVMKNGKKVGKNASTKGAGGASGLGRYKPY